jgi:hypothetical protein
MSYDIPCNLDTLIDYVRLRVGDTDSTAYRYTDNWLRTALISSVQVLSLWMNYRYLLDSDMNIYRNPHGYFIFDEDTYGIIQAGDKQAIIIMACYIILEGSLENSAWDFQSWRDAEISYSNLESSRARSNTLQRLWDELTNLLLPPTKRLAKAKKGSLPGYLNNQFERDIKDLG